MTQDGDQPVEPKPRPVWPVAPPREVEPPAPLTTASRAGPPRAAPSEKPPAREPPPAPPGRSPDGPLWLGPFGAITRGALIAAGFFVLINALLLGLYLWSRGGQHYHVAVEARGDQFAAFLDGNLKVNGTFEVPDEGGIFILLLDTESLPSLPRPRGLDRVRVTDLETNEVLFEDDFSDGLSPEWSVLDPASFSIRDGVLGSDGGGSLELVRPWRDYRVDAYFVNAPGASIGVRSDAERNRLDYTFRPFRHYDNGFGVVEQGGASPSAGLAGQPTQLARSETAKGIANMLLGPYPLMLLLLAAGFVIVLALQLAPSFVALPRGVRLPGNVSWAAMGLLAALAFGVTLYLSYSFGSHIPHVPDEVAYLYQAKIFASGRLTAPAPPVENVFDYFYPPFFLVSDDRWSSIYTFGNSLVLAPGMLVGAPWLVPPLLGAGTIAFAFAIGRKLYNERVALLAAALLASSPFFLMTSANFMSHGPTAFFLMASLFFVIISERRPAVYGAIAGLSFGMMFNTRPLESLGLVPAFAALLVMRCVPLPTRRAGLRALGGFLAGGLVMLIAYAGYNAATSGELFHSNLQEENQRLFGLGGDDHPLSLAIQYEHLQAVFLVLVLHGWPVFIGLGVVLLPLILASRHPWDWFLLLCAASVMGSYMFFQSQGVMHGPRYWYPAAPLLILLAARGADRAAQLLADAAAYVQQRSAPAGDSTRWTGIVVVYPFIIALVFVSVNGWLLGHRTWWQDQFVPPRAVDLKGFNGVDDRLIKLLDDSELSNALVLVDNCPSWQCYGSVFWRNDVTLDGDIVIARNIPEYLGPLLDKYPDRRVYVMSYDRGSIAPYGEELSVPGVPISEGQEAPLATDVPRPTAQASPTPDAASAGERDQRRRDDLATVAGALATYRERHDGYPTTRGLQSLCRYRELDAGCALLEVVDPLPRDPLNSGDYYYESDGTAYVLYARMEEDPGDRGACPDDPPFEEDAVPQLYCVRSP